MHLDEQTVHAHLLVVPRVRSAVDAWQLNSKALFDRARLRELQTSYGEAMAPLGIRRGEPGSKARHSEVAQFYGAVQAAKSLPDRQSIPTAPRPPPEPSRLRERLVGGILSAIGVDTAHDRAVRAHRAELARWRQQVREVREREAADWERMRTAAAAHPLRLRQNVSARPARETPSHSAPAPQRVAHRGPPAL